MPGYVIHLSVAEEYLRKHNEKKENYTEFINGVIFPDSVTDKSKTHYGNGSSNSNLYEFLKNNNIDSSFNRGYFLHLLTDYLFYNKYIEYFSKDIYNDYDILNKILIDKYNIILPDKIKNSIFFKESSELKILSLDLVNRLISEISKMDLDKLKIDIQSNPKKWTFFRELKHL